LELTQDLDQKLLVQPLTPGMTIPVKFNEHGLFLLNFAPMLHDDVWDDYGTKELSQSQSLRNLASHVTAMTEAMEQLGHELKAHPDADEYEMGDYEESWEEICEEMQSTFDGCYAYLADLVEGLADAAVGDFMD